MSKIKKLTVIYTAAALVTLLVYSAISHTYLQSFRTAADYSSDHALEEAIYSVKELNEALAKSVYAVDAPMCSQLCTQICARSAAAVSAISTLPFTTAKLENTSALLNTVGDYGYYLSSNCQNGFSEADKENLVSLSEKMGELYASLTQLHSELNDGVIIMDVNEKRARNVDDTAPKSVSDRMLEYEDGSEAISLEYDGQYCAAKNSANAAVSEDDALKAVNSLLSADNAQCTSEYSNGIVGISCGNYYACVGEKGIESVSSSRTVDNVKLSLEEAERKAEEYLISAGCSALTLYSEGASGGIADFVFVPEGSVLMDSGRARVSVYMDDGSLASLSISQCSEIPENSAFSFSQDEARAKIPESLTVNYCTKGCKTSAGGMDYPCYIFNCQSSAGKTVQIYVDAQTGVQRDIEIS